jgi:hypothetical protein
MIKVTEIRGPADIDATAQRWEVKDGKGGDARKKSTEDHTDDTWDGPSDRSHEQTTDSGWQARGVDPLTWLSALPSTDYGNEQAFDFLHPGEFLYNPVLGWMRWNGTIWVPDTLKSIDRVMLDVAEQRLEACSVIPDGKVRGEVTKAAKRLQNVVRRDAAIKSLSTNARYARRPEEFDNNDMLFACANGVLELDTSRFRPGGQDDMITQGTKVLWNPGTGCDRFLKFLTEIFDGDQAMIDFVQLAVGYSMTGLTTEEVFFILHGDGRNGKGTLIRVLSALFGDYFHNANIAMLLDTGFGKGIPNDVAALAGRRLVTTQESTAGAKLDEALIKSLTGGDLITARFLRQEFFCVFCRSLQSGWRRITGLRSTEPTLASGHGQSSCRSMSASQAGRIAASSRPCSTPRSCPASLTGHSEVASVI